MAAKEMAVRACRDGGFVVYDRIQMVQNPDPIAAFGEIRTALEFVLKAMVPAVVVDQEAPTTSLSREPLLPSSVRSGDGQVRDADVEGPLVMESTLVRRLVPRDEPLMEDDRS